MQKWRYISIISLLALPLLLISMTGKENAPTPYTLPDIGEMGELTIPADNPLTVEGVALGRLLFYDPLLSGNGKQSCGTCHKQEYSFTDGLAKAIGTHGDTLARNTMSLVNLAWQKEFFWDGRAKTLEQLVLVPITDKREMDQDTATLVSNLQKHPHYPTYFNKAFGTSNISYSLVSKALAQFLRTIVSKGITLPDSVLNRPPVGVSEHDYVIGNLKQNTYRGLYFRVADMCGSCHISQVYGGVKMEFNMVNDAKHLMKIPPLVNIKFTAPYMHDGRFASLADVVEHYDEHISKLAPRNRKGGEAPLVTNLSEYDKQELVKFFDYFVDSTLLQNPAYADPFKQPGFSWNDYLTQTYNTPAH